MKDRSMHDKFIIKETVDPEGHRVIVYEFKEAPSTGRPRPPRSRRRRLPSSSFIKVTFEGNRRSDNTDGGNS